MLRFGFSVLFLILSSLILQGCGNGGGGSVTVSLVPLAVSGVAATDLPVAGTAGLKDSAGNPEKSVTIDSTTGAFSFDVNDRQAPFILVADSLFSISGGPGTANINPLSNLLVAEAAPFSNMSAMSTFYRNPDQTRLQGIQAGMSTARQHLHQKLDPLLILYNLAKSDPITDPFSLNQGFGLFFKDVKTTIDANGNVTMTNRNNLTVFTSQLGNLLGGTLITENILPPSTGTGTGPTSTGPGTGTTGPGTGTTGPGTGTTGPGTGTTGPGTGTTGPGTGTTGPGTGTTGPGTGTTGPGTGTTGPGTGTTGPGTGTTGPGTGTTGPGTGTTGSGTGTTGPGSGITGP